VCIQPGEVEVVDQRIRRLRKIDTAVRRDMLYIRRILMKRRKAINAGTHVKSKTRRIIHQVVKGSFVNLLELRSIVVMYENSEPHGTYNGTIIRRYNGAMAYYTLFSHHKSSITQTHLRTNR
jgi:hypothetical protein